MKDIPGFEGLYAVTEDGKIWSHPKTWDRKNGSKSHHNGMWMTPYLMNGYPAIVLTDSSKKRCRFLVHRLVALTHIKIPSLAVNHKNGNRSDNRVDNLEWCTNKENLYHALNTLPRKIPVRVCGSCGLAKFGPGHQRGTNSPFAKLSDEEVRKIRSLGDKRLMTQKKLGALYGINPATISRIITRQAWRHVT